MNKQLHIYDIDGVLVDSHRRYRETEPGRIDIEHWTANREQAEFTDYLLPMAVQYAAQCFNPDMIVGIATARQLHINELLWLFDNLPAPDFVISRAIGDNRPSIQQKIESLKPILGGLPLMPRYYYDDTLPVCIAVSKAIGAVPVHVTSKQGGHT